MGIEWFRDLSIAVLGLVTTILLVLVGIIVCRLYPTLQSTMLQVKSASKSVHDTATLVQESVKPLAGIPALIRAIGQGFKCLIDKKFRSENNEGGQHE